MFMSSPLLPSSSKLPPRSPSAIPTVLGSPVANPTSFNPQSTLVSAAGQKNIITSESTGWWNKFLDFIGKIPCLGSIVNYCRSSQDNPSEVEGSRSFGDIMQDIRDAFQNSEPEASVITDTLIPLL